MTSAYYREKSDRCRLMLAIAVVPEVREQLGLWAHEFDSLAAVAERRERRRTRIHGWRHRSAKALTPRAHQAASGFSR